MLLQLVLVASTDHSRRVAPEYKSISEQQKRKHQHINNTTLTYAYSQISWQSAKHTCEHLSASQYCLLLVCTYVEANFKKLQIFKRYGIILILSTASNNVYRKRLTPFL